jgi:hypothetical protein
VIFSFLKITPFIQEPTSLSRRVFSSRRVVHDRAGGVLRISALWFITDLPYWAFCEASLIKAAASFGWDM